jgi:hypothetical protein
LREVRKPDQHCIMTNAKRTERFRLLYDLGCAFAARIELDELIPLIVAKCREVLNAEGISVLLFDQEHDELFFPYVSQEDPRVTRRLADVRFPAERGIAGEALKTGQAIRLTDAPGRPASLSRGRPDNGLDHTRPARRAAHLATKHDRRHRGGEPPRGDAILR